MHTVLNKVLRSFIEILIFIIHLYILLSRNHSSSQIQMVRPQQCCLHLPWILDTLSNRLSMELSGCFFFLKKFLDPFLLSNRAHLVPFYRTILWVEKVWQDLNLISSSLSIIHCFCISYVKNLSYPSWTIYFLMTCQLTTWKWKGLGNSCIFVRKRKSDRNSIVRHWFCFDDSLWLDLRLQNLSSCGHPGKKLIATLKFDSNSNFRCCNQTKSSKYFFVKIWGAFNRGK